MNKHEHKAGGHRKMICERFEGCAFYNDHLPIESGLAALYKKNYCEKDKTLCARYKVASVLGKERVPVDLYPNMAKRADKLIEEQQAVITHPTL
jgi:hypothetical protein